MPYMATVFLNGSFLPASDACISAFDAGFQHGVGLFETMLAVRPPPQPPVTPLAAGESPHVLHLLEHLRRLAESARELGLSENLHTGALAEAVERTVAKAASDSPDVGRFRIRLTISGGDLNLLGAARGASSGEHSPTLLIHVQPATAYPTEMFTRGVLATLADWKANPLDTFQGHKTVNYWPRLRELQVAAGKRAAEALVFQVTNYLAGGCVSNAFVVKNGSLVTPIARGEEEDIAGDAGEREAAAEDAANKYDPPIKGAAIPSPVLPGIVRRWVMDWALSQGLTCERRLVTISDVLTADELFLTNSSWGVLPIIAFESEAIGGGKVGEITQRAVAAWNELLLPTDDDAL